nr:hypothetical protein Iba_scaffold1038324CG0010 [Ipomoea batatas]
MANRLCVLTPLQQPSSPFSAIQYPCLSLHSAKATIMEDYSGDNELPSSFPPRPSPRATSTMVNIDGSPHLPSPSSSPLQLLRTNLPNSEPVARDGKPKPSSPLVDDSPWTEPATATVAVELAQRFTGDGAPGDDLPCFDEVRREREWQQRWKSLAPTATQAVTLPRLFFVQKQGYFPLIFPSRYIYISGVVDERCKVAAVGGGVGGSVKELCVLCCRSNRAAAISSPRHGFGRCNGGG